MLNSKEKLFNMVSNSEHEYDESDNSKVLEDIRKKLIKNTSNTQNNVVDYKSQQSSEMEDVDSYQTQNNSPKFDDDGNQDVIAETIANMNKAILESNEKINSEKSHSYNFMNEESDNDFEDYDDINNNNFEDTYAQNAIPSNVIKAIDDQVAKKTQDSIHKLMSVVSNIQKANSADMSIRDLVRPVVSDAVRLWLDQNLASIVNEVVRSEIRKLIPEEYK